MYPEAKIGGLANTTPTAPIERETQLGMLDMSILDEAANLMSINRGLERLADKLFGVLEQDPQPKDNEKYEKPTLTTLRESVHEVTYWRRRVEDQLERFKDLV